MSHTVNNSLLLKNLPNDDTVIRLRGYRLHIDRIQFSIPSRCIRYGDFRDRLEKQFVFLRVEKKKNRIIRQYKHNEIRMQLVYYRNHQHWFALSVSDPSCDFQILIKQIFESLGVINSISVKEVEFALDLFPHPSDLYDLAAVLSRSLVLKHARAGFCILKGTTMYQGTMGNARRGSKGLRCYPKEEVLYRIELQANRAMLRSEGIAADGLPVQPSRVNIFDHVCLRRGVNQKCLRGLVRLVGRNSKPISGSAERWRRMAEAARARAIEHMILENVLWSGICPFDLHTELAKPSPMQIDFFKKLKSKYGMTNQVDEYFPKADINELVNDIRNGYVKREY